MMERHTFMETDEDQSVRTIAGARHRRSVMAGCDDENPSPAYAVFDCQAAPKGAKQPPHRGVFRAAQGIVNVNIRKLADRSCRMNSFELNKIMGAVFGALLFVVGISVIAGMLFSPRPAELGELALPEPDAGRRRGC